MFDSKRCDPITHVFTEGAFSFYRVCECGQFKKTTCVCECGNGHVKSVETTTEERLYHAVTQINIRLGELEQRVTGSTKPIRLAG